LAARQFLGFGSPALLCNVNYILYSHKRLPSVSGKQHGAEVEGAAEAAEAAAVSDGAGHRNG